MENLEFLKQLSDAVAPSGKEQAVAALIRETLTPLCDEIRTDKIGNLIALIKPTAEGEYKRIMITAHMDEVGFMVKSIDGDGRVRIRSLGRYDSRVLSGRKVMFTNGLVGLVSSKAIHLQSRGERGVPRAMDKLYIEFGAKDKAETEAQISLGDFGTFSPKFVRLGKNLIAGKALGGRAGVLILCELAKYLKAQKDEGALSAEYVLVFSVKREIGTRDFAISTAAYTLAPDKAIVIDSIPTADFEIIPKEEKPVFDGAECGKGAVLVPMDAKTIYDRRLYADMVALCEKNGLAHQYVKAIGGYGNEAGSIHRSRAGVPTVTVGLAVRNLHSGAEIVSLADMDAVTALLTKCLETKGE